MKRRKSILLLQNNSTATQQVTLFTTNPNQSGPINGTNYGWEMSSLLLQLLTTVQIQVAPPRGGFITLSAPILESTLQAIADALNTLNIGFFYLSGTQLRASNRLFRYGDLTVNQNISLWKSTGTLQVNNGGVVLANVTLSDTRSSTTLAFFPGSGPPPYALPLNSSGTYTFSQLAPGDTINALLTATPHLAYAITYMIRQNGVIIFNSSTLGFTVSLNFPYVQNATYDFQYTIN